MTNQEIHALASELSSAMFEDRRFQRMIREVVLRTLVEQARDQRNGLVAGFFDACESRGVRVTLDQRGHIAVSKDPGPDLAAVLSMNRMDIKAFLEDVRDREQREAELELKRHAQRNGNGVHK